MFSSKTIYCPLCKNNGDKNLLTKLQDWEKGQNNSMVPRMIRDSDWYIALVGRRYACSHNHSVVSYHSGIIQQLSPSEVPFILSHDSGMTFSAFDFTSRLVDHGNSFSSIEEIFSARLADNFYRKVLKMPSNERPDLESCFKTLAPSDDFVKKCYAYNYSVNAHLYKEQMTVVGFNYISCDRTFKTATNIGFFKDKKWTKLFDSLFMALNGKGQVLSYKFCNGTAYEQVDDVFKALFKRNSNVSCIYVDNCCNWRNNINQVFPYAQVISLSV